MNVAGLFAGIGGIELGFAEAGFECALLCENWAPAEAVLASRFPSVEKHGDITTLADLPGEACLLTAGFPCQDLSQAGMAKGITGRRSGLVSHVFRLVDRSAIPTVVLENVPFMLQLDSGRAMSVLVKAFEERGYRWAYRIINTLSFLPQRRERVFFVASKGDFDPCDILFTDDSAFPEMSTSLATHAHGFYWTEGTRGLGWAVDAIPTLKNGSTVGIPSPPAILLPDGRIIKPDIRDAERLQGFEENWTAPAEAAGRSSLRWSLVGNAVSVPVASWLAGRFSANTRYACDRDRPMPTARRWPHAARFDGSRVSMVDIGKFPVHRTRPPLHQFLRHEGSMLSERATRGFLSRADASSLRFVPGFKDRVRAHLRSMEHAVLSAAE
ncbi:MAG: DNA (cytosine-5-)-methyltransferase [Geminicoccaceae bacterium]|nr:DNA (cytosine-5-)-methyltransferase [Geminicoccaceae bacterium]